MAITGNIRQKFSIATSYIFFGTHEPTMQNAAPISIDLEAVYVVHERGQKQFRKY